MVDHRYLSLKLLIKHGDITTVEQIFDHIPKTVIAKDLGHSNYKMDKMIADPGTWQLIDIYKLANLMEYDPVKFSLFVARDFRRLNDEK